MELNQEFEESFCRLAVERGFCEAPAIGAAMREQATRLNKNESVSVAALLVEQGALTQKQAERLRGEILHESTAFPEIPGFEITDELARSGLTRLYQGHQKSVDRPVILKVLAKTSFNDAPAMRQFQREARLLAALNHRHISGAIDMGETPSCLYLVLHHFRGRRLSEQIAECGPLDENRLRSCATALAEALDYIHSKELSHGNLCLENVIVTEDGNLLLTGFDLISEGGPYTPSTSEIAPVYAHPQLQNLTASRVDLFYLGCLLFDAATGKNPFSLRQSPHPKRPITCQHAFVGTGISAIVYNLMELKPQRGYKETAELLADLARLEAGKKPLHAKALPGIWGGMQPELPLWPRSRKAIKSLCLGGAAAGIIGGALLTIQHQTAITHPGNIPEALSKQDYWRQNVIFNQRTDAARALWQQAEKLRLGNAEDRKRAAAFYQSIVKDHPESVYTKRAVHRLIWMH